MSKISVIIAAFKGEKYIAEQLRSLFRQTRQPDEILIGDDSPDNLTRQTVESVRGEYAGALHYVKNPVRLGFVQNFVHLAKQAAGDYIFFCDQDDIWLPGKIEFLSDILDQDPVCQVAVCNSELTDEKLNSLHETMLSGIPDIEKKTDEINHGRGFFPILNRSLSFAGHNIAVKKDFLKILLQIPDTYDYHDLWIFHSAAFLGVMRCTGTVQTKYRLHGNNVSKPCQLQVRENTVHRLREVMNSSRDIKTISEMLEDFVSFSVQYPGNPNRALLTGFSAYFTWRRNLMFHSRFMRVFIMAFSLPKWRQYFSYGLGFRSMIRDLIGTPLKRSGTGKPA